MLFRSRMENWRDIAPMLAQYPEVLGMAPFIKAEGMLSAGGAVNGTMVRGILPEEEHKVSSLQIGRAWSRERVYIYEVVEAYLKK